MGACSSCTELKGAPATAGIPVGQSPGRPHRAAPNPGELTCINMCHVAALIASLPHAQREHLASDAFHERCVEIYGRLDRNGSGYLEGRELIEAVQDAVPTQFLDRRLHLHDTSALLHGFDEDSDGRISLDEFTAFCAWCTAMDLHGFFEGTAHLSQIAEIGPGQGTTKANHLLIVSEFLDPDKKLRECALPCVRCVYYHPDGLTLDEFSAQLESAAYIRRKRSCIFQSVALANHGPDEDGFWHICADWPVPLHSCSDSWVQLMPLFHALADMVETPEGGGHVDLLCCDFAATPGGMECISMIEREAKARFAASTDATGNVAEGGNWTLEVGGRNVAPIYFDEARLATFRQIMRHAKKKDRRHRRSDAAPGVHAKATPASAQRRASVAGHEGVSSERLADVLGKPRRSWIGSTAEQGSDLPGKRVKSTKLVGQQLARELDLLEEESILHVSGAGQAVSEMVYGPAWVAQRRAKRAKEAADSLVREAETMFASKDRARRQEVAPSLLKARYGRFRLAAAQMPKNNGLMGDKDPVRFDVRVH